MQKRYACNAGHMHATRCVCVYLRVYTHSRANTLMPNVTHYPWQNVRSNNAQQSRDCMCVCVCEPALGCKITDTVPSAAVERECIM